jgi:hypothetical protein
VDTHKKNEVQTRALCPWEQGPPTHPPAGGLSQDSSQYRGRLRAPGWPPELFGLRRFILPSLTGLQAQFTVSRGEASGASCLSRCWKTRLRRRARLVPLRNNTSESGLDRPRGPTLPQNPEPGLPASFPHGRIRLKRLKLRGVLFFIGTALLRQRWTSRSKP